MGNQTTIEQDSTSTTTSANTTSKSTSSEPPSWSELAKRLTGSSNSFGKNTAIYFVLMGLIGFGLSTVSLPLTWILTVFMVSLFGSLLNKDSYLASGIAGTVLLTITGLLSGGLSAILFVYPLIISALSGLSASVIGTTIGKKL